MLDKEAVRRITSECYIDYYLSSNDGAYTFWPWRMQPVHEATPKYSNRCDRFLVDSSFNRPEITNIDALDTALEQDAFGVMLEDKYQDKDGTVRTLLEGMELADDHLFNGRIYCPLQRPYVECWKEVGEPEYIALGGLKDKSPSQKISAAEKVRREVGSDVTIHGLGWGPTDKLVKAVNRNPGLIDSIDAATAVHTARHMDISPGVGNFTVRGAHTIGYLLESARQMSPLTESEFADQAMLSDEW